MNTITLKLKGFATDHVSVVRNELARTALSPELKSRIRVVEDAFGIVEEGLTSIAIEQAGPDEKRLIRTALDAVPILGQIQRQLGIIVEADGRRVGVSHLYEDAEMALAA